MDSHHKPLRRNIGDLIMEALGYIVVMLLVAAASYYSAMRAQRMSNATAGNVTAPTAEEGREIPVLFGTRVLAAPNVVWYGDISAGAIKK